MTQTQVGTTHQFVLVRGFTQAGPYAALTGADKTKRIFAELFADPDRSDARPQEAYQTLLASMQPGWTLRLLQLFWPDPVPRDAFYQQVQNWQDGKSEGLSILHQGLLLSIQQSPLPFARRTVHARMPMLRIPYFNKKIEDYAKWHAASFQCWQS